MEKSTKKGIIFTFFSMLFFSSSIFATPYFSGPYIGAGVGVVSQTPKTEMNYDFVEPIRHDVANVNRNMDLGRHGINANLFLGYGHTFKNAFYLGGELFGNYFSPKIKGEANINDIALNKFYSTKVQNPYSFGADMRLGYVLFQRIMLYGLVGADYTKFKIKNAIYPPEYHIPESSDSFNKHLWGILPGFGIEIGLNNHLSLRTQYTYTFYPSFSDTVTLAPGDRIPIVKTKIKPGRGLFTANLSYLFAPGTDANSAYQNTATPYFTGSYLGIGGGIESLYSSLDTNYNFDYTYKNILLHDNLAKHGPNVNVFIGYGKILNNYYYLSGEFFAHYFRSRTKTSFNAVKSTATPKPEIEEQIKNPYSSGIDVRVGYLILPYVMIYSLLGTDYSKFKVKGTASLTTALGPESIQDDFSKYHWGIIPGIGTEIALSDHFSIRVQYTYAFYKSFSHTVTKKYPIDKIQTLTTKIRPNRSLFTIDLSYLWNGL